MNILLIFALNNALSCVIPNKNVLEDCIKDNPTICPNDCTIENMGSWDVGEVTDMSQLFNGNRWKPEYNISFWNVSKDTHVLSFVSENENFDADLSADKLNVAKYMFKGCNNFTGFGLSNWTVLKLQYHDRMFEGVSEMFCGLHWPLRNGNYRFHSNFPSQCMPGSTSYNCDCSGSTTTTATTPYLKNPFPKPPLTTP